MKAGTYTAKATLAHPENSSFTSFVESNADAIVHGFVFGGENSVPADTMAAAEAAAKGAAK